MYWNSAHCKFVDQLWPVMIDISMMNRLIKALKEKAKLILVGDQHQLGSVESGSVFRELCRYFNTIIKIYDPNQFPDQILQKRYAALSRSKILAMIQFPAIKFSLLPRCPSDFQSASR